MKINPWGCVMLLLLSPFGLGQNAGSRKHNAFLQQPTCPLTAIRHTGASVVLRNTSGKLIVSYTFACFERRGKTYLQTDRFSPSVDALAPGKVTGDAAFDATPLNSCKSSKWLLGICSVRFADGSEWKTEWPGVTPGNP